ncbi:uncharacterized protein LOC124898754 [Capsicum annuum]|uniref:uncharacterized protein LOC124898754 n=1 Tax=Capsicum annuum TaxID=4072 RepID=UPI001FB1233F|nr:uncharacterized protein LOC124898754 [Capsicum annuum]
MSLPPKVLNFIWRSLRNILPTCESLFKKKCVASSICLRCLLAPETVKHCLIECHFAKQCWIQSNFGWHGLTGDFVEWFEEQRKRNLKMKLKEAVMILWSLWEARNNLCWNNKQSTPTTTLHRPKKALEECQFGGRDVYCCCV